MLLSGLRSSVVYNQGQKPSCHNLMFLAQRDVFGVYTESCPEIIAVLRLPLAPEWKCSAQLKAKHSASQAQCGMDALPVLMVIDGPGVGRGQC